MKGLEPSTFCMARKAEGGSRGVSGRRGRVVTRNLQRRRRLRVTARDYETCPRTYPRAFAPPSGSGVRTFSRSRPPDQATERFLRTAQE
jgi:hypothetical protein